MLVESFQKPYLDMMIEMIKQDVLIDKYKLKLS